MNRFLKIWTIRIVLLAIIHLLLFSFYTKVFLHENHDYASDSNLPLTDADQNDFNELCIHDYEIDVFASAFSQLYNTPFYVERAVMLNNIQKIPKTAVRPYRVLLDMNPLILRAQLDEGVVCNLPPSTVVHYREHVHTNMPHKYNLLISTYALNRSDISKSQIEQYIAWMHEHCQPGGRICMRILFKHSSNVVPQLLQALRNGGFHDLKYITIYLTPLMLLDTTYIPRLLMHWWKQKGISFSSLSYLTYCSAVIVAKKRNTN